VPVAKTDAFESQLAQLLFSWVERYQWNEELFNVTYEWHSVTPSA
jgi:hypothetical protein